jgi:hypothetical protein
MELSNRDFTQLVKDTREKFDVGLDEAHDILFADEVLRRLVAWRIKHDRECRKEALLHMHQKGELGRFVLVDGMIRFRD